MEITSFILGVCAVIVIMMVVGTFVNYMSVKQLKEQLDNLDRDIHTEVQILNQNLDKETERLTDYVDSLHNISENNMNEIYRYIDSRMDKLETKFRGDIASGVEVRKVIDKNELLEQRLNRFIETYQNQ
jgi:predicted PurR-regulated permease PerM